MERGKSKEKSPKPQMCRYCLKKMSKRHLQRHESRCAAANLCLPDGYRVEKEKRLTYTCPCGYTSRRSRIFHHIAKHHSGLIKSLPSDEPPEQYDLPDIKIEEDNKSDKNNNRNANEGS